MKMKDIFAPCAGNWLINEREFDWFAS